MNLGIFDKPYQTLTNQGFGIWFSNGSSPKTKNGGNDAPQIKQTTEGNV